MHADKQHIEVCSYVKKLILVFSYLLQNDLTQNHARRLNTHLVTHGHNYIINNLLFAKLHCMSSIMEDDIERETIKHR